MGEIFSDVKKAAIPFAVLMAAALYFGLVGPGKSTPAFLQK